MRTSGDQLASAARDRRIGSAAAIGERLREARVRCGQTQVELAECFGVSVHMLKYWESGESVPYSTSKTSPRLRTSSAWLLYGVDLHRPKADGSADDASERERALRAELRAPIAQRRALLRATRELLDGEGACVPSGEPGST